MDQLSVDSPWWEDDLGGQPTLLEQPEPAPQPIDDGVVLVLEDDQVQRQILVQHLDSIGLKTVAVPTIGQAREVVNSQRVILGLFDLQLPDGSGLEFSEDLDCDERYAGMPIVMLTSYPIENIVRKSRASGGSYFICKPYDPNVLLAVIERLLSEV